MSVWQWIAVVGGWNKAHGGGDTAPDLSAAELADLAAFIDEPAPWLH